jgi:catechol 2,3-dioxygenase-like lactoylglutathione lyase family enzyme
MPAINVEGIDHVHVQVANRDAAAEWFGRVLGLQIAKEFDSWAKDPRGPLFLVTPDGVRCLALFEEPDTKKNRRWNHTIAFKVSAWEFVELVRHLDELQLTTADGSKLSRRDVVDHELSWSIYFIDPDGNRFELTAYQYDEVSRLLAHGAPGQ